MVKNHVNYFHEVWSSGKRSANRPSANYVYGGILLLAQKMWKQSYATCLSFIFRPKGFKYSQ